MSSVKYAHTQLLMCV